MTVAWLITQPLDSNFLRALSKALDEYPSTLLYDPLDLRSQELFPHCDAAFPLCQPQKQIESIDPELICLIGQAKICSLAPILTVANPSELKNIKKTLNSFLASPRSMKKKILPFTLSVLIRTKNSEKTLPLVLKSLYSQNVAPDEIFVVDSQSNDKTIDIVKSYGIGYEIIDAKDYFPGKVLNDSLAKLKGDVVTFLNSDTILLTNDALLNLVQLFQKNDIHAAFSRQIPWPNAMSWVKKDYKTAFPVCAPAPAWMPLSLCFAAMRRSTWEKRPFYTEAWGSEDIEWGLWAQESNHNVSYIADALAMHSHNYTLKQIYGRKFIEGEADAMIRSHRITIWNQLVRYFKSVVGDIFFCLRQGDASGVVCSPIRRGAYHFGYWKGYQWGRIRKKTGNKQSDIGQKIVLSHYEE